MNHPSPTVDSAPPNPGVQGRLRAVALRYPELARRRYADLAQEAGARGDWRCEHEALYGEFFCLERKGRAAQLRPALEAALARTQRVVQDRSTALIHEAMGRLCYQRGAYDEAAAHWHRSAEIAKAAEGWDVALEAQIGSAQIHYAIGAWGSGLQALLDAAALASKVADPYLDSKLALNMGVGHFHLRQFEAAEAAFQRGLTSAWAARHRDYVAEAYWHLARTAQARGETDAARDACERALVMAARNGYLWLQVTARATLAELAALSEDLDEAIELATRTLELAAQMDARRQQSMAHKALARLHQSNGQPEQALEHLWKHLAMETELVRAPLPQVLRPSAS